MRRNLWAGVVAAAVALGFGAGRAAAQENGSPTYKSPYRSFQQHEAGVSFTDPGGYDWTLEGFYSYGWRNFDVGLRAGYVKIGPNANAVSVGADLRTRVISWSEHFPLDGSLTLGAGADIGDGPDVLNVPIGLSLGRHIELEGSKTTFTPFVHPIIVPRFGTDIGGLGDNSDVAFAVGLGVDINLNRSLSLRVSGGIGDSPFDGVGVSVAWIR
jgi:opacity protein-like surface antigen